MWMAENLNYAYLQQTVDEDSSSFCYLDHPDSCAKYGRLYLWSAAMDSAALFSTEGQGCGYGFVCQPSGAIRGVCPEGWHLPDTLEFDTLFAMVGGREVAGKMLKSSSGWFQGSNGIGNGLDAYGFSVLPAGFRYDSNSNNLGNGICFWTSNELSVSNITDNSEVVHVVSFDRNSDRGIITTAIKNHLAFSVRCIKDAVE